MMDIDNMPRVFALFPNVILLAVVILFAVSALLQWLWNITITRIFGVREITYWEAFRLLIITEILFGGRSLGLTFEHLLFINLHQ
ncbi:MAG: hypothetical protein PWR01_828 [Clostridiales bacterium]|jgi:hypothetical protein|nr:hypothetical protein [Clostridiales bacterium]